MRQLKGRGLAIAGAILAMIPLFTCCCCVIGLPVGIWALVVLMNAEVKAAFDAGAQ
jgi:ABC-type proline/glycine betaine transport system permease subunit